MKKNALAALYEKDGTKKVLSSLISIVAGLLVGGIAVLIVGLCNEKISLSGAWDGIRIIFAGIFSTGRDAAGTLTWGFNAVNLGNMLFRATPLIMTGLSVAVAFKTGLFNIGAPGQYLISTMVTLMVALSIPSSAVPVGVIWVLAFLAGCLSGALWGAIPGLVKALLNINEVLACIMTNWIAANLVTWMFDISSFKNLTESTKSGYIYKTTFNGVATPKLGLDMLFPGSQVNGGILVAIVIAIAMYILMNKTTLGYELKACGANRHAARYAGIRDKRNIVLSMAIAGALAGDWVALQGLELLTMLVAAAMGAVFSLLLSFASINLRADQTIGGTALNLMAPALVLFLIRIIANQNTLQMATGDSASWFMLKKSTFGVDKSVEWGFFGETFLNKIYLATYICILLFIILSVILYKTRFGLRLRACGENPQAADSLGINVYKMRYAGVTISGALAGMGGFVYAMTTANCSSNGDVAGFGFLALAVMIFGNWKPLNIAGASLLFGLFKCIAAAYASIDINGDGVFLLANIGISAHLYRMLPYLITLLVLAFTSKKSRAPKAEGIPYDKGQR